MKRPLAVLVASLALSPVVATAQEEEAAIRQVTNDFIAAWSRHDVKAMVTTFAPDADLINPFGRVAKGRAEIEKLLTEEHAGPFKGTTYAATVSLRMLSPTLAFGDWESTVTGMRDPGGNALPAFKHHVAAVYVKKDGRWMALAARPYVFLPPPPPPQ